jgi:hypothetical protein
VTEVDTAGPTVKLSAGAALLRRIVQDTPVRINGVPANASAVGDDYLVAVFVEDNLTRAGGTNLKGKTIELVVDSIIQITYKAVATGELPAESAASGETVKLLPSLWEIQNPSTGRADWGHRRDPVGRPATITVSSRAVGNDGKLTVRFTNLSNTSVRIAADDITVLYPKGDFAGSIIRSTALIVLQLMFLAAIGIWAGSFLSFPVACLVCLAVLPFSLARTFLTDAVRIDVAQVDWITTVAHYVNRFMSALLPDFGANWPSDWLVDGVYIPWAYVSISGVLMVAVRGLALLALACLIFRKRELARVQV